MNGWMDVFLLFSSVIHLHDVICSFQIMHSTSVASLEWISVFFLAGHLHPLVYWVRKNHDAEGSLDLVCSCFLRSNKKANIAALVCCCMLFQLRYKRKSKSPDISSSICGKWGYLKLTELDFRAAKKKLC